MRSLSFRPDGTFTIVQFTDVHWQDGGAKDRKSLALMEAVLDAEKPDLVVYTGDIVQSGRSEKPIQAFRDAVSPPVERGIPWAAVFGNNDTEKGVTREELMSLQRSLPHCLSEPGPDDVSGVGNFVLSVYRADGSALGASLYFLDSHDYGTETTKGYGWIRRDQIDWYVRASAAQRARGGAPAPGLAFFHIPLPEYKQVWKERTCYGERGEKNHCPNLNTGFFAALLERNEIIGTFVGHDHKNDYWGELFGIRLCYGKATGYNTYPHDAEHKRGARVVRLHQNRRAFDTWLRLDGVPRPVEQPVHEPKKPAK